MDKTRIEWCDATWNPVSGCYHNCKYCYARRIANRYKGCDLESTFGTKHRAAEWSKIITSYGSIYDVSEDAPPVITRFSDKKNKPLTSVAPYPFGFEPTLRRDRLDIPLKWKEPRTIFVCSMSDLFGDWVPDRWIDAVFDICKSAPQHRYLFLTKNPARYLRLANINELPVDSNFWYGSSVTNNDMTYFFASEKYNTFVSAEPLLKDLGDGTVRAKWIIIGAETGNRKSKVIPEKSWIDHICEAADKASAPVFMKDSLIPIIGEDNMRREFPWRGV